MFKKFCLEERHKEDLKDTIFESFFFLFLSILYFDKLKNEFPVQFFNADTVQIISPGFFLCPFKNGLDCMVGI